MDNTPNIVLQQDNIIDSVDTTITTSSDTPISQPNVRPNIKVTPEILMSGIRDMISSGKITQQQSLELRRQFGITNNYFTKKHISKEKKKHKQQISAASRRRNRLNACSKGQKRNNGHTISSAR